MSEPITLPVASKDFLRSKSPKRFASTRRSSRSTSSVGFFAPAMILSNRTRRSKLSMPLATLACCSFVNEEFKLFQCAPNQGVTITLFTLCATTKGATKSTSNALHIALTNLFQRIRSCSLASSSPSSNMFASANSNADFLFADDDFPPFVPERRSRDDPPLG